MIRSLLLLFFAFNTCYGMSLNGPNLGQNRIAGGENLTDEEVYPYMVSIQYRYIFNIHQCGGSIIAKRTVLTAAHCLTRSSSLEDHYVVAGTNRWRKGGVRYRAEEIRIHPDYNATLRYSDIGLVIVNRDIIYAQNIQPIAINPTFIFDQVKSFVIGWGKASHDDEYKSEILKYLSVDTIENSQCASELDDPLLSGTNLCIKSTTDYGICDGDDGSPIISHNMLIGMIAWSHDVCGKGNPSVASRISFFNFWIQENIVE